MPASSASTTRGQAGWRAELIKGAQRLRRGDAEGARQCFARAHALAPKQAGPALALGREEWKRGRISDAERLLRTACGARPTWSLAAAALARVLIERGSTREAREVLRRVKAPTSRSAALRMVQGELELADGDFSAAASMFESARKLGACDRAVNAGLARAENARGMSLSTSDRVSEAAFAFKRAADLDPAWAPPQVNLGSLLQTMGRPRAAAEHYRRALELNPRSSIAHFNLGLLARQRGDLAAAQRSFAAALAGDAPPRGVRVELALVHADRGDDDAAIALLKEEARTLSRPDASLYVNLGLAYARKNQAADAETALRKALTIDPSHPKALTNLAALCAADGRYLEAASLLRRARGNSAPPPASK